MKAKARPTRSRPRRRVIPRRAAVLIQPTRASICDRLAHAIADGGRVSAHRWPSASRRCLGHRRAPVHAPQFFDEGHRVVSLALSLDRDGGRLVGATMPDHRERRDTLGEAAAPAGSVSTIRRPGRFSMQLWPTNQCWSSCQDRCGRAAPAGRSCSSALGWTASGPSRQLPNGDPRGGGSLSRWPGVGASVGFHHAHSPNSPPPSERHADRRPH